MKFFQTLSTLDSLQPTGGMISKALEISPEKLGENLKFKKLGENLKFKKLGENLKFKKLEEKFKIQKLGDSGDFS